MKKEFCDESFLRIPADFLYNPDMIATVTNIDIMTDDILTINQKSSKKKRTLKLKKENKINKKALD